MRKNSIVWIAANFGVGTVVCAAILVCVSACSLARSVAYQRPGIDDHKIFSSVEIEPSETPFTFHEGTPEARQKVAEWIARATHFSGLDNVDMPLGEYLATRSGTVAFLVIRNDTIMFEEYYRGYDRTTISTLFSVSKSVTSLLTGIAVDEGHIGSVDDPVTRYIPELARKDARFERLTVEHLLDMRSGFDFDEQYGRIFSKNGTLYYGTNYLRQLKRMRFKSEPGSRYEYQSATTALLGLVVQRATGRNLADYLQAKVWTPLSMENRASWSVDDRRHRMAKADCGLNATARDLARIGRLYMHGGEWNGTRIVSPGWVERSVTPNPENRGYQYQWYSMDREEGDGYTGQFYAMGIMKQVLWVDPSKDLIMVRLGEWGDKEYETLMRDLAKTL